MLKKTRYSIGIIITLLLVFLLELHLGTLAYWRSVFSTKPSPEDYIAFRQNAFTIAKDVKQEYSEEGSPNVWGLLLDWGTTNGGCCLLLSDGTIDYCNNKGHVFQNLGVVADIKLEAEKALESAHELMLLMSRNR